MPCPRVGCCRRRPRRDMGRISTPRRSWRSPVGERKWPTFYRTNARPLPLSPPTLLLPLLIRSLRRSLNTSDPRVSPASADEHALLTFPDVGWVSRPAALLLTTAVFSRQHTCWFCRRANWRHRGACRVVDAGMSFATINKTNLTPVPRESLRAPSQSATSTNLVARSATPPKLLRGPLAPASAAAAGIAAQTGEILQPALLLRRLKLIVGMDERSDELPHSPGYHEFRRTKRNRTPRRGCCCCCCCCDPHHCCCCCCCCLFPPPHTHPNTKTNLTPVPRESLRAPSQSTTSTNLVARSATPPKLLRGPVAPASAATAGITAQTGEILQPALLLRRLKLIVGITKTFLFYFTFYFPCRVV